MKVRITATTSIIKILALSFFIASSCAANTSTLRGSLPEARLLQQATFRGNNLNIKLNLCEGDCDSDDDCQDGLVCYERNPGQPIPGCSASSHALNGNVDYCVSPSNGDTGDDGGNNDGGSNNKKVSLKGDEGSPSSAFPLGLCEGDCDSDSDCQGDLVCFQRGANQDVPGCDGGLLDSTSKDYCIENNHGGNDDDSGTSGGSSSDSFNLRMYWEKGYNWQGESFERKWCAKCYGSSCGEGDMMVIDECGDSPTKLSFVNYGSEFQIQVSGHNLCFELQSDRRILLKACSSSSSAQRWMAQNGSTSGTSRFELVNKNKSGFCVTQRHHPKEGEDLHVETCEGARKSHTSYWRKDW